MTTVTATPDQPIRMAYVLKMYPRFSETFILNEILELERQGVDVRIFSLKKPNDGRFHADVARVRALVSYAPESPLASPGPYLAAHREVFSWGRRRYLRTLALSVKRRRWGAVKRFLQAGYIAPVLRREGITHVHAHFATSATSVALYLHQLAGISYTFTAHAKDIYADGVNQEVLGRKLHGARFAVTVSDYNQAHLTGLAGATPVVRIYNGLDLEQFAPNGIHPDDSPLILGVGRLVEKKGFPDLIRACAILRDGGCRFRCQIVGAGPDEPQLRDLIEELGLDGHVELTGPLPRETLLDLYPRSAVVVAPCVIGSDGNRDGLPTVLIEAMALGVPVISTDVTGIPELIEHGRTGLLAPQGDPDGLARTIQDALADPSRLRELAKAGRERVQERFDLTANVARLRELFEQVAAEPATAVPIRTSTPQESTAA